MKVQAASESGHTIPISSAGEASHKSFGGGSCRRRTRIRFCRLMAPKIRKPRHACSALARQRVARSRVLAYDHRGCQGYPLVRVERDPVGDTPSNLIRLIPA